MSTSAAAPSVGTSNRLLLPWAVALMLPLPALVITPGGDADVPLVYLAVGSAWFAAEAFRRGAAPTSSVEWRTRMLGLALGIGLNVAVFTAFGTMVGARSHIPLGMLAVLSVVPALGLVPWLTLRSGSPAGGVLLGVVAFVALKLVACVLARIVYGPDYIEHGYVAGDWRTAKLMIATMWTSAVALSLVAMVATARRCSERR